MPENKFEIGRIVEEKFEENYSDAHVELTGELEWIQGLGINCFSWDLNRVTQNKERHLHPMYYFTKEELEALVKAYQKFVK